MLDERNDMPIEVPVVQSRSKNWKSSKSQKNREKARGHADRSIETQTKRKAKEGA